MCTSPITIETTYGPTQVACKQCLQCRIHRQSSLTFRCLMENQMRSSASFVTLTYKEAPDQLNYDDFSKFLKRLRDHNRRNGNQKTIRYFGCGEYGAKSGRPHFHALIWDALPFPEEVWRTRLWPFGFVVIGTVTPASMRYTARYCLKFAEKGKEGMAHWSRNPGLGHDGIIWLADYMRDRGDVLKQPPTHCQIDKSNYSWDNWTRTLFWKRFAGEELPTKGALSHLNWAYTQKFGDPTEAQRKKRQEMQHFWEKVKVFNEKV